MFSHRIVHANNLFFHVNHGLRSVTGLKKVFYAVRLCASGQVRDNILFGCAYDAHRYEMVLEACALKSVSFVVSLHCFFQLFNFFSC